MIDETLAMEAAECLVEDIFEPATAAAYYEGMIIRMGKEISVTLDDETAISIPC